MASTVATKLLRQHIIEHRRAIDFLTAKTIRLKVELAEGDPELSRRLDSIAELLASSSNETESLIESLNAKLR